MKLATLNIAVILVLFASSNLQARSTLPKNCLSHPLPKLVITNQYSIDDIGKLKFESNAYTIEGLFENTQQLNFFKNKQDFGVYTFNNLDYLSVGQRASIYPLLNNFLSILTFETEYSVDYFIFSSSNGVTRKIFKSSIEISSDSNAQEVNNISFGLFDCNGKLFIQEYKFKKIYKTIQIPSKNYKTILSP